MRIVFTILFALGYLHVSSQSLTGEVYGADKAPVEFATIRLFNRSDSTVAGGAISDSLGKFEVNNFSFGEYYVKITFSGHEPYIRDLVFDELNKTIELGVIVLQIDKTLELEGVIAKGSLDILRAGIDKKVYNTEDDLSVRGGSVQDVLNNIPSIQVDQDGNISLRGDGNVTILIDGRPSTLTGGGGQNILDAIPANSIERIEVVTNPSARYDPDGTSGIINIVLKKNKVKGFSGMVSGTGATGNLYEGNLSLSYRSNKLNTYMNYSFNYYDGYRNYASEIERMYDNDSSTIFTQSREGTDMKMSNTLVVGADYYFNDRNSIAFSTTGSLGERERWGYLENYLTDGTGNFIEGSDRESLDPRDENNLDLNLNFKHDFKKQKGEWTVNLNRSYELEHEYGYYTQIFTDSSGGEISDYPLYQRLNNTEENLIYSAQTDFSYVIEKIKARVEGGVKYTLNADETDAFSETRDSVSGNYFEDTLANFRYAYDQSVAAVYGIFGQELGKYKYQIGFRGEYATQEPNLISENEKYLTTYLNLFPSAHLKYNPKDDHELSLSYSRRINRPRSHQLNPFTSYADPFNLRAGNPFLTPEYIDSYDLGYSYTRKKFIMTVSVFHRRTTDVLNRVRVFYPNNVAVLTWGNIDNSQSTGFEGVFIIKPYDWFKTTLSANGNYAQFTDDSPGNDWNNSGLNWGGKFVTNIDFWKKSASVQINYNYNAPWITPQGRVQRKTGVDLSVEKRLLNKKLSVILKVTDLFDTKGFRINLDREDVSQETEFKWLTRRYYLTVSYKFGKYENKVKNPGGEGSGGAGGEE